MTKRNIKELKITFENCEMFTAKREYIEWFYFGEITDTYYPNKTTTGLELSSSRTTKNVSVKLSKEIDDTKLWMEKEKTPIQRITECSDLASFIFVFEDGTEEELYVNWVGDNAYYNPAQQVEMTDTSIMITINEENVKN